MATKKKPAMTPPRTRPQRMVQNFHLVWLDGSIDEVNSDDYRNSITKLREVINTVNTFTDVDECIDFINSIEKERAFIIFSGFFGQKTVPVVHNKTQVSTICIFCGNKARHEKWAKEWPKIKGIYTDIVPICEALKQAAQDCDHNSVSISFAKTTGGASSKESLDTLDSSFMYTQILKEILLTIDFEQSHINDFLTYCREQLVDNTIELRNVDKLQKEYRTHQPIWWYTYDSFLYSMLNRSLRLMEVDLIIKMGFFVRDLHNHIVALHAEQYDGHDHSNSFTVYRAQGLSSTDFEQLMNTQGGLLAFNNFLSTSQNHAVSLEFARQTIYTSNLVGVLFVMEIDPSINATPFANVENVSYYQGEEEILFSMHSVFRIGQVKQLDENDRLWQVNLTLTGDNDPQLCALTERVRNEIKGSTEWVRLASLMVKLAQYDKAEDLLEILLPQATDKREKGDIYYQLGCTNYYKGKYKNSIPFFENSLEIRQKTLTSQHPDVADCYNDIGLVYDNMGEYSKALSSHEKALEIYQKTLPANHPDLATSYNNIGSVCSKMGEYSKALSSHEKALEIFQKTLPENHPHLATSYNNIGSVYDNMGEYSKALSSHEKALEIRQKTLPANHPLLATSYNNIAWVYKNMGEYSKALSYYEKALEIRQKTLPANHPDLATSYNNIGLVYYYMREYSKALSSHEKALEIRQKTLPANHPDFAQSYNNIGGVYYNMGEYSKALSYYEKALEIFQKTLPENHPHLATSYACHGSVYYNMGEHSKALSYFERAFDIRQRSPPPTHPDLKSVKEWIEIVKEKL
jgi:tetratricopeptide (TPR) repeat protein